MPVHKMMNVEVRCDCCSKRITVSVPEGIPNSQLSEESYSLRGWSIKDSKVECDVCHKKNSPFVGIKGLCPHPNVEETSYNYHRGEGSYMCKDCGKEW